MGDFLGLVRQRAGLASSPAAVDEAARNLARKAPDAPRMERNLRALLGSVRLTSLVAEVSGVEAVEKGRHIFGAAVASQCTHLLTGDERHFEHLFGRVVGGVRVVHASLLADETGIPRSGSTS